MLGALEVAEGPDGRGEYWAFCPAHDDRNTPNLHVRRAEDGDILLRCFAGCTQDEVLSALEQRGVRKRDLFYRSDAAGDGRIGSNGEAGERGVYLPPESRATLQPRSEKGGDEREKGLHTPAQPDATPLQPCTLEVYAEAKKLPVELLKETGLSTVSYMGNRAVKMPYLTEDGQEGAVRLRLALEKSGQGDNRFRWRKGSKPTLYGLWRMDRLLFYPVSRVGFDGLIYRMGGDDQLYGTVTQVTDGDTIEVETQGRSTPVRLIGVDTPETVDSRQPIGCFGSQASDYTAQVLYERQTDTEGATVLREGRLVRLEIPRIGDSEDAYGRTLAYVYLDTDGDGCYEHSFNEDLVELGLARTIDFSHEHSRKFDRLREQAEERGAGLWGACSEVEGY